MNGKHTIVLNDAQYYALLQLLNREWNDEWLYQIDGNADTELLETYLDLYRKVLGNPKGFAGLSIASDIAQKIKELNEVLEKRGTEKFKNEKCCKSCYKER